MADDRDDLDELDPELEAKLDKHLDRVLERRAAARKRNEAPKDFGEMMDRIRDEVTDVLENDFGLERKSEGRKRDDAPTREGGGGGRRESGGGKRSAVERFWGVGAEERTA